MKRAGQRLRGKQALELFEDAFHEVRRVPLGAWLLYALGALPFLLGVLSFWADMSQSAFAAAHLTGSALGVSLLFVWLKFWQVAFVRRLQASVAGERTPRWTLAGAARAAAIQLILQASGLFLLPLAFCLALPFSWTFAFYQNVTVIGDGDRSLQDVLRLSARRAQLWQRQNHVILLLLVLFAFFVFINALAALLTAPYLLRTLLGIETSWTRSGWSLFNTTLLAIAAGLTWLCVDPFVKAIYHRRCFEAEYLGTGADLRAQWRSARNLAKPLASLLLLGALEGALSCQAEAADVPHRTLPALQGTEPRFKAASAPSVSAKELDHSIERVLAKRDYVWRLKRQRNAQTGAPPQGGVAGFFDSVGQLLQRAYRTIARWIGTMIERIVRLFRPEDRKGSGAERSGLGWIVSTNGLLLVLLALVTSTLAVLFFRRRRRRANAQAVAAAIVLRPERAEEELAAAELPEDQWRARARHFLSLGDLRQTVRALYLGSLASLSAKGAIALARHKSNRDYERELARRHRLRPELQSLFAENVSVFERVWYGRHSISREIVDRLDGNLDRLKAQLET